MERKAITLDVEALEERLNTKIALVSSRKNTGFDHVKELITEYRSCL